VALRVRAAARAVAGARSWLKLGAVDYNATVALNGVALGRHVGAMEAFEFDVTSALSGGAETNVLEVVVEPVIEAPAGGTDAGSDASQCWLNDHAPK